MVISAYKICKMGYMSRSVIRISIMNLGCLTLNFNLCAGKYSIRLSAEIDFFFFTFGKIQVAVKLNCMKITKKLVKFAVTRFVRPNLIWNEHFLYWKVFLAHYKLGCVNENLHFGHNEVVGRSPMINIIVGEHSHITSRLFDRAGKVGRKIKNVSSFCYEVLNKKNFQQRSVCFYGGIFRLTKHFLRVFPLVRLRVIGAHCTPGRYQLNK